MQIKVGYIKKCHFNALMGNLRMSPKTDRYWHMYSGSEMKSDLILTISPCNDLSQTPNCASIRKVFNFDNQR